VSNEAQILAEIDATQGSPEDIGGYYYPDDEKTTNAMRPSKTLNSVLAG
jgi:isocitrate dehydrogenase